MSVQTEAQRLVREKAGHGIAPATLPLRGLGMEGWEGCMPACASACTRACMVTHVCVAARVCVACACVHMCKGVPRRERHVEGASLSTFCRELRMDSHSSCGPGPKGTSDASSTSTL